MISNYIEVQDRFKPIQNKPVDYHPVDMVVRRNKYKGSSHCMKIMGYVTYFVHKWVDKVYLMNNKNCKHSYFCECKKKLLSARKQD